MASKFLIYFAVFCIRWSCVAEVHTSMDYFLRVVDAERQVIQELKKFVSESEIEYSSVRRYVDDFELVLRDHEGYLDQEGAVKNPIGVFQIVKMLTVNWIYVEEVISDPSLADVYEAVAAHRQGLILPELKDLKGAAVALVRLQDVYDLQVTSLARGEILGLRGSVRLSARDCRFIGENAFLIGYFNQSIAWYEHALHLSAKEGFQTITEDEITPFLKQATDALINETDYSVTVKQPNHTETNMDDTNPFRLKRFPTLTKEDRRNYEALCKGQRTRSPQTENNFRCYLTNQKKPYFFLQPVKLEVHNFYPPLFTIHDVISDWEIEFLKNISRSKLLPSTVVSSVRGNLKTSSIRTSQSAWLNGEFEDNKTRAFLDRIDIRIGLLTGLETVGPENAEPLQVVNYGTGGHYNPHHDYIFKHKNASQKSLIPPFQLAKGDRMATFLIYLTDVTRGGATVFLRMGVAIQPIKGSAAFWYNLQLNGEAEPWTMHAACPVAYGSKWIANKWIRENNQLFTRPCSLREFTNPLIYRPLKKGNVL